MADLMIALDLGQPVGQRFAPEVREEIGEVAPSQLQDGDVTEPKIADEAVSKNKIQPGAVDTTRIASEGVDTANYKNKSVTGAKMADDTITPLQTTNGIPTSYDNSGNAIALRLMPITSADFSALGSPDPNTLYFIY